MEQRLVQSAIVSETAFEYIVLTFKSHDSQT